MSGVFRTDNRTVQPGDVFIALQGESFDGHDFADAALAAGAAAAVVRAGAIETDAGPLIEVDGHGGGCRRGWPRSGSASGTRR